MSKTKKTNELKASQARLQLALGYTAPIVGAAVATVAGLILNDTLGSKYFFWVWLVVLTIVGVALIWGTTASSTAHNFVLRTKKQIGATGGARTANFVLSIIWSTVAAFMSVGFAQEAVSKLRTWTQPSKSMTEEQMKNFVSKASIEPLTADRFVSDFLPAFLILVVVLVGTIQWLLARSKEK